MKPRVLITRETERAVELIKALAGNGIDAFAEPVTRTVTRFGTLPDLTHFQWVAFTSVNGVRAFAEAVRPEAVRFAEKTPPSARSPR